MHLHLFYGTAICLDVTNFAPCTDISADDLDEALATSGQQLQRGDIVLFHTACWNRHSGTREYLTDFPGLGDSASKWIAANGVKTFGVDSPTPDTRPAPATPAT